MTHLPAPGCGAALLPLCFARPAGAQTRKVDHYHHHTAAMDSYPIAMDSYQLIAPSIKTFDSYPDSYHKDSLDSYHKGSLDSYITGTRSIAITGTRSIATQTAITRTRSIATQTAITRTRYGPSQRIHLSKPSDIYDSIQPI